MTLKINPYQSPESEQDADVESPSLQPKGESDSERLIRKSTQVLWGLSAAYFSFFSLIVLWLIVNEISRQRTSVSQAATIPYTMWGLLLLISVPFAVRSILAWFESLKN